MKYGQTLAQWSIPAWVPHNVDYDEIKRRIKDHTSSSAVKPVSIPGQGNEVECAFEKELYDEFVNQHGRVGLFIRCKSGEIDRKLALLKRHVAYLHAKGVHSEFRRLGPKRRERYARLESEIIQAGEELQALSRFIVAQRIAFAKLLKKYKKWTGSDALESRFRRNVLGQPGDFTKETVAPLLDSWTDALYSVRTSYVSYKDQAIVTPADPQPLKSKPSEQDDSACNGVAAQTAAALENGTELDYDRTLASTPLGDSGCRATYFVHPDNVLELLVLLLQHARRFSASPSPLFPSTPQDATPPRSSTGLSRNSDFGSIGDTGTLILDEIERFAEKCSGWTVNDTERCSGLLPAKATGYATWTPADEAAILVRDPNRDLKLFDSVASVKTKRKKLGCILSSYKMSSCDRPPSKYDPIVAEDIKRIHQYLAKHRQVRPLAGIYSNRTRFVGVNNDASRGTWIVLDQNIAMKRAPPNSDCNDDLLANGRRDAVAFPFAVLEIRQDGPISFDLIRLLDYSHLTERVRGFALEAHAVWECCKPDAMPAPIWLPILASDIRKAPAPVAPPQRRRSLSTRSLGSCTVATMSTPTTSSAGGLTSGSTTDTSSGFTTDHDRRAASNSVKNTWRLSTKQSSKSLKSDSSSSQPALRYYSEYDEANKDEDTYYIYVDPNSSWGFPGQNAFAYLTKCLKKVVTRSPKLPRIPSASSQDALLGRHSGSLTTTPSSSSPSPNSRASSLYGTFTSTNPPHLSNPNRHPLHPSSHPHTHPANPTDLESLLGAAELIFRRREAHKLLLQAACLATAATVLALTFVLAATGRRRARGAVDIGVAVGFVVNLALTVVAMVCMWNRQTKPSVLHLMVVVGVVAGICVADGVLLSWVAG